MTSLARFRRIQANAVTPMAAQTTPPRMIDSDTPYCEAIQPISRAPIGVEPANTVV